MSDLIDDALAEVQALCKTSWSENEIIAKLQAIRQMRNAERLHLDTLQAVAQKAIVPRPNERWG